MKRLYSSIGITGGLKLNNISLRQKSLYISWIAKIQDDASMMYVYDLLIPNIQEHIWECNLNIADCKKEVPNCFWRDVLITWAEVHFNEPQDQQEVLDQIIWYNSLIRINDRVLQMPCDGCVIKIADIIKEDDAFCTYEDFKQKFQFQFSWLQYQSLIHAIPPYWKVLINSETDVNTPVRINFQEICQNRKCSAYVYNYMINELYEESNYRYWWK